MTIHTNIHIYKIIKTQKLGKLKYSLGDSGVYIIVIVLKKIDKEKTRMNN